MFGPFAPHPAIYVHHDDFIENDGMNDSIKSWIFKSSGRIGSVYLRNQNDVYPNAACNYYYGSGGNFNRASGLGTSINSIVCH